MVFLLGQYSKVFAVLTRSRSMHACSLGMSLDDHKQLLGVIFLSSSLSAIFLVLSGSLGSSFQSSSQKAGALVTPFCCTSVTVPGSSQRTDSERKQQDWPYPPRRTTPPIRGEGSPSLEFWLLQATATIMGVQNLVSKGMKKNKNRSSHSIIDTPFSVL